MKAVKEALFNDRGVSRHIGALFGADRLIFRMFVLCAFRPGELFALRWRCFSGEPLQVEESVLQGVIGKPKTRGSAATVVIPKSMPRIILNEMLLRPAAESVGVQGVTFQSLRRTFATHFHRIGTLKDQQTQMRHSNAQTTPNVYTQAVSESLRAAMKIFDQHMKIQFEHK